jgi:adenylate cyclase
VNRITTLLFLILATCLLIAFLAIFSFIETIELKTLDLRFRLCSKNSKSQDIVLITINDATLKAMGYPLSRDLHSLLIDALSETRPKAIGFDILFTDPSRENPKYDSLLASKTEEIGNICHAVGFKIKDKQKGIYAERIFAPLPQLEESAKSLGHINILPDIDGVVRRMPLLITYREKPYYSLGLQVVADYLDVPKSQIKITNKYVIVGNIQIPVNKRGEMLINYTQEVGFAKYSFLEVLQSFKMVKEGRVPTINLQDFRDKLVLIGVTAAGASDLRPTPKAPFSPMLFAHALLANNIITQDFIHRAHQRENLFILLFLLFPFSFFLFYSALRYIPFIFVSFLGGFLILSFLFFRFMGLWIEVVKPTMVLSLFFLGIATYRLAVKRGMFRGYSLEQMVEAIDLLKKEVKGFGRGLTFLDIDIVNSARVKEKEEEPDIYYTFAEYHKLLDRIAKEHNGKVFNRAGDGVIFQFQGKNQADQAIRMAMKIRGSLVDFNKRENRLKTPIVVRMGINTGKVLIDGSMERGKVSSSTIDIAGHLQKEAEPGQILVSQETFSRLTDKSVCKEAGYLERDGIQIYSIFQKPCG